mgnify:CR=1 FL=1
MYADSGQDHVEKSYFDRGLISFLTGRVLGSAILFFMFVLVIPPLWLSGYTSRAHMSKVFALVHLALRFVVLVLYYLDLYPFSRPVIV